MRKLIVRLCLLGLAPLACAAPVAESKPVVEFPSAASLQAILAKPAVVPPVTRVDVPAEGWTVDAGPALPTAEAPWQPRTAWDRALQAALTARPTPPRLTQALSCVARELGRYQIDHRALPPDQLQEFMVAACGSWAPHVGIA